MACDFRIPAGMTPLKRKTEIEEAMDRLQKALAIGTVKIKVGPQGAVTFVGNWDRRGISDTCAYRKLLTSANPAVRLALVKAEAEAGRKISQTAVASGVHSHNNGKSWDPGHK